MLAATGVLFAAGCDSSTGSASVSGAPSARVQHKLLLVARHAAQANGAKLVGVEAVGSLHDTAEHMWRDFDKAAAATYPPLVEGVRAAVEQGVFTGDPERVALHLWVVAHGVVSLELSRMLPVPPEHAAHHYEQAVLLAAHPFIRQPQ
ncbi:MAG TPA: TetR-like C-terminal domain-containing protein [Jatrophihabitans sp.]|nr:TetR-like C-terminal domain-containing protein [Jatrophihabitans sp.]